MIDESTPQSQGQPEGAIPEQIGPYRILEWLGAGGMGTVYLAEQQTPVRRRVALKVIKGGMDTKSVLARFEIERQALAIMQHPNIASVFDAGATSAGKPYFVMEYVKGIPITEHCDRFKLPLRERIRLLISVCSAVQHSHQKGVMHRDLKPSNVLVSVQGEQAEPKIIDFGLARATDHRLAEGSVFTELGAFVGTPSYMSPEQAGLGAQDVDTRTDVYSLGILLFELLVGEPPLPPAELRNAGPFEIQRRIREEDAPRPSTRVSTSATAHAAADLRRTDTKSLGRALRTELDWIVLKAVDKDRTRRYQTCAELAAELQRYLNDEPVHATPPTVVYRLRKFVKRHRMAVAIAAVIAASLVALRAVVIALEAKATENLQVMGMTGYAKVLERARAAQAELYPAWPEQLPDLQRWMDLYGAPLLAERPRIAAALAILQRRPQPLGTLDQLAHDTLEDLLKGLESFTGPAGEFASVRDRMDWAAQVDLRTHGARDPSWDEAIAAIRTSGRYGGLTLKVQRGLVPVGADPVSGLWEFVHLRSGEAGRERPERNDTGRLVITGATGIVLVLIPGQGPDPAYFLGKYEVTQAQWKRLSEGATPSLHKRGDTHPVENLGFVAARGILQRHRLVLPTQAQWKRGAAGATSTRWWTGDDEASLVGKGNLADASLARNYAERQQTIAGTVPWDDGHAAHAPVDAFEPNPYGLYQVVGNVCEYSFDPEREQTTQNIAIIHGGDYMSSPDDARTERARTVNVSATGKAGLRAARPVLP